MSLAANPLRQPEAFNKLNVAGNDNPGLFVRLGGGSRSYKWDRKDAKGAQGATSTYQGWDVSSGIKAQFQFWTADQIDEFFNSFLALLQYDATKQSPQPIEVFHPTLFANGVQAISVDDIGPLEDLGKQLWSVTIEMSEFRPPPKKNATSTPKAPIVMSDPHGDPNGSGGSIEDRIDAELEKEKAMADRPLPVRTP